ncbi:hypothetical protein [Halomonas elongata]|uniref:Uncharacterized protein n=1 Tax=Halomonas elongata (strain ATCC 33173 / DSM 2581 / NBRC 15536 / NCIMB 2198 / 1H9) TaxID=768066 RepID=A0ABZ0TD22_HALED|nr:hypothetical protein [Halomonas elongata]WBF19830.1 hypothetical protein LM502_09130 [Halomonas elongata]WPU48700.1 hypothetical protein SR933_07360 [Halomonas elongata DSM 2581]
MSLFLKWFVFRCCISLVSAHAQDFRGAWEWVRTVLGLAVYAGFAFTVAFLGRMAWDAHWARLLSALAVMFMSFLVADLIVKTLRDNAALLSLPAVAIATWMAFLLW